MSNRILAHLTPAALNYLTSRSHSPPLSSNHSSVSSSLCSQEEKWGNGENGKFRWVWPYDLCPIVSTYAPDSILLCILINDAICPIVKRDSRDFRLTLDRLLSRGCVRWLGPWVADLTILSMISSAVSSVQFTGSSVAEHHGGTRPETIRSKWMNIPEILYGRLKNK